MIGGKRQGGKYQDAERPQARQKNNAPEKRETKDVWPRGTERQLPDKQSA